MEKTLELILQRLEELKQGQEELKQGQEELRSDIKELDRKTSVILEQTAGLTEFQTEVN